MEDKVRGRDIIAQVVENMRSQGEELRYSTIVPSAYDVYLHPADFQRLESLAGAIADQARRALDEAVAYARTRKQFGAPLGELPLAVICLLLARDAERVLTRLALARR